MNIKNLIIIAVFIVVISSPFLYFQFKKKEKKYKAELDKYSYDQKGTYNWLMGMYDKLIVNDGQKKYRKATDIANAKLDIGNGMTLLPLKEKFLITKDKALAQKLDWGRKILVGAIEKGISYQQSVIDNLEWLEHDKYGYDVVETIYN